MTGMKAGGVRDDQTDETLLMICKLGVGWLRRIHRNRHSGYEHRATTLVRAGLHLQSGYET